MASAGVAQAQDHGTAHPAWQAIDEGMALFGLVMLDPSAELSQSSLAFWPVAPLKLCVCQGLLRDPALSSLHLVIGHGAGGVLLKLPMRLYTFWNCVSGRLCL